MTWFFRRGYLFIPSARAGWVIFAGVVAYLVFAFLRIHNRSLTMGDTLMNWSFHVLVAGLIYSAIGYIASAKKD